MYVHPAFKTEENSALEYAEPEDLARSSPLTTASRCPRTCRSCYGRIPRTCASNSTSPAPIPARDRRPRAEVMMIVWGPDAYISPDWYVSPEQVPTWNYVSVHLNGKAPCSVRGTLAHVEALSQEFEGWLAPKKPWSTAKMPEKKRDMMLRAIVQSRSPSIPSRRAGSSASTRAGRPVRDARECSSGAATGIGRALSEVIKQRFADLWARHRRRNQGRIRRTKDAATQAQLRMLRQGSAAGCGRRLDLLVRMHLLRATARTALGGRTLPQLRRRAGAPARAPRR